MLVLSRRENEVIEIEGGIKIVLIRISGTQVRIGIDAPKGVRIVRQEVAERARNAAIQVPGK